MNVLKSLNMSLTYLFDELICNIQQHAQADKGYAYLMYNKAAKAIEMLIADFGITIYGSYVAAQKHLDKLFHPPHYNTHSRHHGLDSIR